MTNHPRQASLSQTPDGPFLGGSLGNNNPEQYKAVSVKRSLASRPLRDRLANRYAAWAARKATEASGFSSRSEPLSLGAFAKGKQILAGQITLAGHTLIAPERILWDVLPDDPAFVEEAHGFSWLDDLAALGSASARQLAQVWTRAWFEAYGSLKGLKASPAFMTAWQPHVTGRRITRILHQFSFLTFGLAPKERQAFMAPLLVSLPKQAAYLERRALAAPAGAARIEALLGRLYVGLMLKGQEAHAEAALGALEAECEAMIAAKTNLAGRNPEDLADILLLLGWALQALDDQGQAAPEALRKAIDHSALTLRLLRHSDGSLPRFHGSSGGVEGQLDQAISISEARPPAQHIGETMGYLRLSGGRTSLILDAESPPAETGHASTGAMEVTSGRRPLIVSCGSGLGFGAQWSLAGRATQSHSVLSIDGISSSRFGRAKEATHLAHAAKINAYETSLGDGAFAVVAHDGWSESLGLTSAREVQLAFDGRRLNGWDTLISHTAAEQERLRQIIKQKGAIPFSIHFHLHPESDATLDMAGTAVSIQLRSSEIWIFRHDGQCELKLSASAYLEKGQEKPRVAKQIVLSGQVSAIETRIGWTLAKAQDTPLAIRDLDRDDPLPI